MTDTWGIPGTTFLWAFIAVAGVAALYAFFSRAAVRKGAAGSGSGRDTLPPSHVAYLAEGPQRAVYASLALLRRSHAIDVDEQTGRFQRLGPPPAGSSQLDAAVLHAAGQQLRDSQIRSDAAVLRALADIRQDLERRGFLLTDEQRRSARRGGWVLLVLLGVGIARLFSGLSNDRPVGYLALALLPLGVLTLIALRKPAALTPSGRKYLNDLRRQYHYLDKSHRPAWQTYDPTVTAIGVGLFGAGVLLVADPLLAAQTHVRAAQTNTYAGDSGGSYGGGDSGGGGGGGGDGGGGGGGCGG